ncbi:TetR/AcrR family transcriptional regulator [Agromyces protaetiae]|uniref:TetR/AcrR family transcriptional regulator n=1 Tax=Agromyces protaetiae TaxID=2509455 RepID=A0A4P6FCL8_9MICO|nr:TetR family transcriptional regulator [Agromyces protaetiae]QAY73406.1 TetR/AcrR family transcriptional regulator [Agromyces protaetiae]
MTTEQATDRATESPGFKRARTDDQRAERREAILAAAVELLGERRVADLSLNELARHVGLAKSNVLRYFESREAVLLDIYDREYRAWLDALEEALPPVAWFAREPGAPGSAPPSETSIDAVATAIADTIAVRPMLCELAANTANVLEHNVSGEVAATYKRTAIANAVRLGTLVSDRLGPYSQAAGVAFVSAVNLGMGAIWASTQPSPGMAAAYVLYPDLARYAHDFGQSLREYVATVLTGLAHREPSLPGGGLDGLGTAD